MSSIPSSFAPALGFAPWLQEQELLSAALPGGALPGADAFAGDAVLIESGLASQELLTLNSGIAAASGTSNALSTANDALGVIGGLLGNIQAVLSAAGPSGDPSFDPATEQTRIDSAVSTIDAVASSAQFGGLPLLDGAFSLNDSGGSLALPSFLSQSLGSTQISGGQTGPPQALSSLVSGGPNDLASGNLAAAGQIVNSALSQVSASQNQINSYQSGPLQTGLSVVPLPPVTPGMLGLADMMYLAAAQMLSDPLLSAAAVANSAPSSVLALLPF